MERIRQSYQGRPRKKLTEVAKAIYKQKPKGQDGTGDLKGMDGAGSKLMKVAERQAKMNVGDDLEVWPENVESVNFFADECFTQWRVGMGGCTGLDYTAVLFTLRNLRLGRKRTDEIFADVRIMERGALEQMAEDAEKKVR